MGFLFLLREIDVYVYFVVTYIYIYIVTVYSFSFRSYLSLRVIPWCVGRWSSVVGRCAWEALFLDWMDFLCFVLGLVFFWWRRL